MVQGLDGSNTAKLMTLQKKIEANLQAQESAVEKFRMTMGTEKTQVADQKITVGNKQMDYDMAVTTLANFKVPEKPDEADYYVDVEKADGESMDEKEFDETSFKAALKEYEDAVAQKATLEDAVKTASKELGISEEQLELLIAKSESTEAELLAAEEKKDYSIQDLQDVKKQIAESTEKITIDGSKNSKGMVDQTLKDMLKAGVLSESELKSMSTEQRKAFADSYVKADNSHYGTDFQAKDGYDDLYTKASSAKGRGRTTGTFTAAELSKMLNDASTDSASYSSLLDDIDFLKQKPEPKPEAPAEPDPKPETPTEPDSDSGVKPGDKPSDDGKQNINVGKNGEITLPRGMDLRVGVNDGSGIDGNVTKDEEGHDVKNGEKATTLEQFGIIEVDGKYYRAKKGEDGELEPRYDRAFSADEINKYFRQLENSVDYNYSKWLNKAQKLGLDIDAITKGASDPKKALKDAVKAKEAEAKDAKKLNKAERKYAAEIEQYGLNVDDYKTAGELKTAIKEAKRRPLSKVSTEPDEVATPSTPTKSSARVSDSSEATYSVVVEDVPKAPRESIDIDAPSRHGILVFTTNSHISHQNVIINGISYQMSRSDDKKVILTDPAGNKYELSEDRQKIKLCS